MTLKTSWARIISLATLQGAISLTWLVYNTYLPKLLVGYGFPASLAISLLIIENAIAAILEPLFGSLADRREQNGKLRDHRWISTKFGFVSLGVILTSALTILIPTIFVFGDVFSSVRWILPGVLIAWAMAMTVFRAPAISLIGKYAADSELPIAMSFLTLFSSLIGALKPVSQNFILNLGAPIAFSISSIVLLYATVMLRYFEPPITINLAVTDRQPILPTSIGLVLGMGWGIAWGSRCLLETLPKILKLHQPQLDPMVIACIFLLIALSAIPGGLFAAKYGNRRAMSIGIITTLIALLLIVFLPTVLIITLAILLIIVCLTWMTNGAIPLAINIFPNNRAGLAVGLYVGGFSAGMSSFNWLFNPASNLTPLLAAVFGSIGLILAGVCVWQSHPIEQQNC